MVYSSEHSADCMNVTGRRQKKSGNSVDLSGLAILSPSFE
jgi:hypothetical protein